MVPAFAGTCVRCEEIQISGGLTRQKMKFERFLKKRMNTKPSRGPIHYRSPARILWRTTRGMLPHKTVRGEAALRRLKCFEGIPPPYDCQKRVVVPRALKVARLRFQARVCHLGELATSVRALKQLLLSTLVPAIHEEGLSWAI
eukprot:evm.model.scf_465EXC.6 EVM.evm.TU.scf_465EXC.6   scf_465EXC:68786-69543(-)